MGISDRNGIGTRGKRGGELSASEFGFSSAPCRKLVSPVMSTFSTTPTMTCSTR